MAFNWYAVTTYTSQEAKVVNYIREFIDNGDLEGIINNVMDPAQDVVQIKNGKKTKVTRRFFPGYILVEMELCKEAMHFVQTVNGVSGFVGGKDPKPLKQEEVSRILGQTERDDRPQLSEVPFENGDAVKIKEGPFKDFDGVVDEVHPEKGKVRVMVSVFGRSTPVELDFLQVDPVS